MQGQGSIDQCLALRFSMDVQEAPMECQILYCEQREMRASGCLKMFRSRSHILP